MRKVNEIGLKLTYKTRDDVRDFVRSLSALSHVPINDVPEAFNILIKSYPQVDHIDELVTYFEHTYIRGRRMRGRGDNFRQALLPVEVWNCYDAATEGIAKTNKVCEGWHHSSQSLFQCSHPTLWRFLQGIKQDCCSQKATYLGAVAGVVSQLKKRYRTFHDRVSQVTANY